jgi:hypothetical protein
VRARSKDTSLEVALDCLTSAATTLSPTTNGLGSSEIGARLSSLSSLASAAYSAWSSAPTCSEYTWVPLTKTAIASSWIISSDASITGKSRDTR